MQRFRPGATFVHLADGGGATTVPVAADFWQNMPAIFDAGRMVSLQAQEEDWSGWEMHPQGDEFILMISGKLRLVADSGEVLELDPGEAVLMPAGTWHTADVLAPGQALFITPGAGTQSRPRERASEA